MCLQDVEIANAQSINRTVIIPGDNSVTSGQLGANTNRRRLIISCLDTDPGNNVYIRVYKPEQVSSNIPFAILSGPQPWIIDINQYGVDIQQSLAFQAASPGTLDFYVTDVWLDQPVTFGGVQTVQQQWR